MNEAEKVVKFVAAYISNNSERESSLLYPDPQWLVNSYGLLEALGDKFGVADETISRWVDEAKEDSQ